MRIKGSVALVTGANRGLGAAFARGLLAAGASTVYGAARSDFESTDSGLVPVRLDVTEPDRIAAIAGQLSDVNVVINNAGVFRGADVLSADLATALRANLETNVIGLIEVSRAFAPVLAANGGGALVNILSVGSWRTRGGNFTPYAISKAAAWSATNSLRLALRPNGTLVVGVHAGFIDTDMAASVDQPKITPEDVVTQVIEAIENDREEVLTDDRTRQAKALLSAGIEAMYPRES